MELPKGAHRGPLWVGPVPQLLTYVAERVPS